MQREGTDPENVQMSDILCDFCRAAWAHEIPMIEGHHGSIICGKCLRVAYAEVVPAQRVVPAGVDPPLGTELGACTMCLETRPEPMWQSPMYPEARACRRCIKLAAGTLAKDKDFAWPMPRPAGGEARG